MAGRSLERESEAETFVLKSDAFQKFSIALNRVGLKPAFLLLAGHGLSVGCSGRDVAKASNVEFVQLI